MNFCVRRAEWKSFDDGGLVQTYVLGTTVERTGGRTTATYVILNMTERPQRELVNGEGPGRKRALVLQHA